MSNLFTQQKEALTKHLPNKVGALFMKMGTGKTRVTVELVNSVSNLDLVVWVGPLRSIKPLADTTSIIDEVNKWGGFNASDVVYIGVETISQSDRQYIELHNKIAQSSSCFIVVDESIKIKNHEAKRTQRLLKLSGMVAYKLILNGEPITRDLLDIWAQFQFLDPAILRMSLSEFKNTFCKYTTISSSYPGRRNSYTREFITGYENIDYLYSLIGEYVYECDLELDVKQVFETKHYKLSQEEKNEYEYYKGKYLNNETLMIMNNNIFLEMTQKMQHQYCCSEEKFEVVDKWITNESKTIIFCKYIASMDACKERYPEATVLNYKTGSLSLNLQDRPYTVYFDQTWDWGDVAQSQHRNYRAGQTIDCKYLQLIGNVGLENLIRKNNKKKIGMSEYFKMKSFEQIQKDL